MTSQQIHLVLRDLQSSTDGTTTVAFTNAQYAPPSGSVTSFRCRFVGRDTGGKGVSCVAEGTVKNVAGSVSITGTPSVSATIGDATLLGSVATVTAVSSTTISPNIVGIAVTTISWGLLCRILGKLRKERK